MQDFDFAIIEVANRLGMIKPISVSSDVKDSSVRVGYGFRKRPWGMPVQVEFGAIVAVLTKCEFDSLIAHEFAHILAGHTSWLGFRLIHCLPRMFNDRMKTTVINFLIRAIQYRTQLLGKGQEFEADKIACTIAPAASMGRVLVKAPAFCKAFSELLYRGKIGEIVPVLDCKGRIEQPSFFESLSVLEIIPIVLKTFESNRSAFIACSQRAKRGDRSLMAYPSVSERLEKMGLEWDSVQDSCVFNSESLINFEAFFRWATDLPRVVAVPFGKTLVAAKAIDGDYKVHPKASG